jgi:glycosyltransferase involved in cell wall biosynthesis
MEGKSFTLCAVIPISRMAGKLELFKSWVLEGQDYSIFFVIVHDWRDQETENELISFLSTLKSERYAYVSSKFGSPGMTRNAGISNTVGEWIAFWDSDDLPNLKNVMAAISASGNHDEVLIGNYEIFESTNNVITEVNLGTNWQKSVARNPGLWRMVFRRDAIGKTIFSDLLMGEDQLFLIEFHIFERRVKIYREKFYSYQTMQDHQATKNRSSLSELTRCLKLTRNQIGTLQTNNLIYYQRMFIRQSLTALKRLKIRGKISALKQLLIFSNRYGFASTIRITLRIISESSRRFSTQPHSHKKSLPHYKGRK